MLIETFNVGMLATNCYVVNSHETKEAIIIDPGIDLPTEVQQIFDYITEGALKIKLIVNTHGHQDHINGDATFQAKYNVPVYIHKLDASSLENLEKDAYPPPVLLEEGSIITLGEETSKSSIPQATRQEASVLSAKDLPSQATPCLQAALAEQIFQAALTGTCSGL